MMKKHNARKKEEFHEAWNTLKLRQKSLAEFSARLFEFAMI